MKATFGGFVARVWDSTLRKLDGMFPSNNLINKGSIEIHNDLKNLPQTRELANIYKEIAAPEDLDFDFKDLKGSVNLSEFSEEAFDKKFGGETFKKQKKESKTSRRRNSKK